LTAEAEAGRRSLADGEQHYAALQGEVTGKQVAAAKCEQRVEMLRLQAAQAERNQQERKRALAETQHRLATRQAQLTAIDEAMLLGRHELATFFLQKEQHLAELTEHATADEALRRQRSLLHDQINSQRQQLAALQSQQHKLEVATNRLRHERQTLCERMQDDYGIDLAEAAGSEPRGRDSFSTGDVSLPQC
jgi:chromosome segregation ATPase